MLKNVRVGIQLCVSWGTASAIPSIPSTPLNPQTLRNGSNPLSWEVLCPFQFLLSKEDLGFSFGWGSRDGWLMDGLQKTCMRIHEIVQMLFISLLWGMHKKLYLCKIDTARCRIKTTKISKNEIYSKFRATAQANFEFVRCFKPKHKHLVGDWLFQIRDAVKRTHVR